MKDYKRLTKRITASNTGRTVLVIPTFRHEIIEQTNRLAELEDKIESGELVEVPKGKDKQNDKKWLPTKGSCAVPPKTVVVVKYE